TLLRALAGLGPGEPIAREVGFQHPPFPRTALAQLEAAFACPLRFNEGEMRLVLPRALLDRPLVSPNPGLFAYLERHAEALQARVATAASLTARVRELVVAHLRQGEPEQAAIAQALALSERTLQRRLQDEGVTFANLLD